MTNWKSYKLGEVAQVKHGYAFKGEFFCEEETDSILLTPGNFQIGGGFKDGKRKYYNGEILTDYILNENDLIVTMTDLSKDGDTLGYSALVPTITGKYLLHNQRIGLVNITSKEIDKKFLYWVLRTSDYHNFIVSSATGSTVKHTSPSRILEYQYSFPPLKLQQRIADILGALDDKIEVNRQMNQTLEDMAQALFKHHFVDEIDPENLPKGWTKTNIEMISDKVGMGPFGANIKVETFTESGMPIISGQHLRGTILEDNNFNYISIDHAKRLKNSIVQRGDVIFTHAGNIGQVAFIPKTSRFEKYIISQRQFYLRPKTELCSAMFLTLFFKSKDGQHVLLSHASSTGVPSISQPVTNLRKIQIILPDTNTLYKFDSIVDTYYLQIGNNNEEIDHLTEIRDYLLPKLMSGEITPKELSTIEYAL